MPVATTNARSLPYRGCLIAWVKRQPVHSLRPVKSILKERDEKGFLELPRGTVGRLGVGLYESHGQLTKFDALLRQGDLVANYRDAKITIRSAALAPLAQLDRASVYGTEG